MPITHIPAPPHIKSPPLSFATRIGDTIYVSGIPGFDAEGAIPDAFDAQFANVVTNIGNVLTQAGATLRHLVKVNVLLTRASDVAPMNKLYAEAFGPSPYPGAHHLRRGRVARSEDADRDRGRCLTGGSLIGQRS